MKLLTPQRAALMLLAIGLSTNAHADDWSGSLIHDLSSTDFYSVECDAYTEHFYLQVGAGGPKTAPTVSAQIIKDNQVLSVTDPINGDTDASRVIRLHAGPGFYNIVVSKTRPGKVAYGLVYHCEDKNNQHTVTETPATLQDDVSPN